VVIVNVTSHEWSKLSIEASGAITGDAAALSRLSSLARFIAQWYAGVSVLFILGVGIAGHVFFSQSQAAGVAWQGPWWTVVGLAAVQLWLMPILSLLEGCNQVVSLNRFRLGQTLSEAFTIWILLAAGAGLWVAVGAQAARVVAVLVFLLTRYRRFFRSLLASAGQERIRWRQEIWPMQWRLALQGSVNYLMFSLFTPVMFHYHGPVTAGRMGMTLQITGMVQSMAIAWVQTKVPRFGMMVARRDYAELDRTWWQASKLSVGFAIAGSLSIWLVVLVLDQLGVGFASRILGPTPTALFLTAYGLMLISYCHSAYLRAHAREPFLVLGVSGGILIGGLVFLFGSRYGPTGAAAAFAAVAALFVVPISTVIWMRRRVEWQRA
jgi:O-antigen/teichoic acid export membrane protein